MKKLILLNREYINAKKSKKLINRLEIRGEFYRKKTIGYLKYVLPISLSPFILLFCFPDILSLLSFMTKEDYMFFSFASLLVAVAFLMYRTFVLSGIYSRSDAWETYKMNNTKSYHRKLNVMIELSKNPEMYFDSLVLLKNKGKAKYIDQELINEIIKNKKSHMRKTKPLDEIEQILKAERINVNESLTIENV